MMKNTLILILLCAAFHVGENLSLCEAQERDASTAKAEREHIIAEEIANWQSIFGPVSFADEDLFQCVLVLRPHPFNQFQDFNQNKLSEDVNIWRAKWIEDIFRGPFKNAFLQQKPSKFYLRTVPIESSLLLFDFQYDRQRIRIMENDSCFFLIIKPEGYNPASVNKEQVIVPLINWINLNNTNNNASTAFGLHDTMKLGDVFTNRTQPKVGWIGNWDSYIIGFISKEGICIIIYKANGDRAQFGFLPNHSWLDKGIIKPDGTNLSPPNFN